MIIDVTGFGWSGSGAVHDLLREYDDIKLGAYGFDWEFTLLWTVDGIYDLEQKLCVKHCRFIDSNIAIKRFLRLVKALEKEPYLHYDRVFNGHFYEICNCYINDLIQLRFNGKTLSESIYYGKKEKFIERYNSIVRKLLGNHIIKNYLHVDLSRWIKIPNSSILYLSYKPSFFLTRTHRLMEDLFSYVRKDSNLTIVTDQVFPPDCPNLFFKYVSEPVKCIIVRRDPRDTYLLAKVAYRSKIPIPTSNVNDFIVFYRETIEKTKIENNSNILNICFEDLVYNYDQTKEKIEKFTGIKKHAQPLKFFDPNISVNNTQLFNKYTGYKDDILKIKKELPHSLYPFEKYTQNSSITSHVF